MDTFGYHKALYKENAGVLSPRDNNQIIRDRQKASRAQQRKDNFHTNRMMYVNGSPEEVGLCTPLTKSNTNLLTSTPFTSKGVKPKQIPCVLNKENENVVVACTNNTTALQFKKESPKTSIAKVACAPANEVLTRKEAFLKRFVEWRNNQKAEHKKKLDSKRKPSWKPIVAAACAKKPSTQVSKPSFAAKNHKFQPPEIAKEVPAKTSPSKSKRQSLYVAVETPEKKRPAPTSIARKVLQQAHIMKNAGLVTIKDCLATKKPEDKQQPKKVNHVTSTVNSKPIKAALVVKAKAPSCPSASSTRPQTSAQTTNIGSKAPASLRSKPATSVQITNIGSKAPAYLSGKPLSSLNEKSKPFDAKTRVQKTVKTATSAAEKPTKSKSTISITKPSATSRTQMLKPLVANEDAKQLKKKPVNCPPSYKMNSNKRTVGTVRGVDSKRIESSNVHKKPNLAVGMKATKKPTGGNEPNTAAGFRRPTSKQTAKKIFLALKGDSLPIVETPKDPNPSNPFEMFVTSTKFKDDQTTQCEESEISPIAFDESAKTMVNRKQSAGSSAKRALLESANDKQAQQEPKKFNFEYYSAVNVTEVSSINTSLTLENEQTDITVVHQKAVNVEVTSLKPSTDDSGSTLINDCVSTPPPNPDNERPINYMSPFVTVSRGKVSAKAERDRRNSMYMANSGGETPKKSDAPTDMSDTPVEVRRTLEAVRYFHKQLHDETERLRAMCAQWEQYKSENLTRLVEMSCEDKIDSTIGQTMLLTVNKFQQFYGLIERCAAGATGSGAGPNDGSEDSKLVTATDLEGFWAMLGLQIENVEKRFTEIERWRANDWIDPDALVVPKTKKSNLVSKVKNGKTKASKPKPSSGLVELMRKKHAELRKLKGVGVVSNISNNSQSRGSSHGATQSPTPRRRSIIVPNRKQFSPAATVLTFKVEKSNKSDLPDAKKADLRKSVMLSSIKNRSPDLQLSSPKPRKSILKTPGTAKTTRKSVLFSAKKSVRRFKFVFDEPSSSDEEKQQSDTVVKEYSNVKETVEDLIDDLTPIDHNVKSNVSGVENIDGTPRTYGLRNRKVKLRPSSEFVIPRKS